MMMMIFVGNKILDEQFLFDYVSQLLKDYERLGPIVGILLPFIEALLPFLPLIVFVFVNTATYGLFKGFLFSWIGATLGSIVVFIIIRRLGNSRIFKKIRGNKQVAQVTGWVTEHGFGPLFVLLCFPFSPSSIINVVAGLSHIRFQQFVLAVVFGKAVMIFSLAYVGSNIFSFADHPIRTSIIGLSIVLFWMLGKYIEKRLKKRETFKTGR